MALTSFKYSLHPTFFVLEKVSMVNKKYFFFLTIISYKKKSMIGKNCYFI